MTKEKRKHEWKVDLLQQKWLFSMIFQLLVYWRVVFQGEVKAGWTPKVLRVDHQWPRPLIQTMGREMGGSLKRIRLCGGSSWFRLWENRTNGEPMILKRHGGLTFPFKDSWRHSERGCCFFLSDLFLLNSVFLYNPQNWTPNILIFEAMEPLSLFFRCFHQISRVYWKNMSCIEIQLQSMKHDWASST